MNKATKNNSPKEAKVGVYIRIACVDNTFLFDNLSNQTDYYTKVIKRKNKGILTDVYADIGTSGTNDNRPQFQRLLADCREGKIDSVVTKTFGTLTRNTSTLVKTMRELNDLGVNIFFEKDNLNSMDEKIQAVLPALEIISQEEVMLNENSQN